MAQTVLDNVDAILLNGAKLIIDKVYDSIGFNRIGDNVLRQHVVARLCRPMSKMATVDYLKGAISMKMSISARYTVIWTNSITRNMERLKKAYASGKITKDKINKRGYSKFLKIDNDVSVSIDDEKIKEDEKWDGLKGYVTNTELGTKEVVAQY